MSAKTENWIMKYDEKGLIPAIVQHARSGEVLMLGYMNEEALRHTRESGLVTFWSRSRNELWQKGATSGNVLRLVELREDCDGDALLVLADPAGPTCHTGERSCFHRTVDGDVRHGSAPPSAVLARLAELIEQRRSEQPEELVHRKAAARRPRADRQKDRRRSYRSSDRRNERRQCRAGIRSSRPDVPPVRAAGRARRRTRAGVG